MYIKDCSLLSTALGVLLELPGVVVNEILSHLYQRDVIHQHFNSIFQRFHICIRVVDVPDLPVDLFEFLVVIPVLPIFLEQLCLVLISSLPLVELHSISRTKHASSFCSELFFGAKTGEEHEGFVLGRGEVEHIVQGNDEERHIEHSPKGD